MIRKASLNDVPAIHHLEKRVLGDGLGQSFLYDELAINPFGHYFVYEKHKEIVAYVGFRAIDDSAEMMNFVVDIDYQDQGIGSELMEYVLLYLENLGVSKIALEVRKSNKRARHFYEKFQFKSSHTRANYYEKEDAVVYIREVTK
ncbi:MAG: ribosomal protein S18-alanine N-acetyltransferase [Acholeplasmataceae bacterium]|jgi:ribosomal-protein-alanine N-acetyltransferase